MPQVNEWLLIAAMAFVTYLTRYPMMVIVGRVTLPPVVVRALKYVPVAVLTAISVPAVLMPGGVIDMHPQNAYLVAGIISTLIAWRTKNLLATILIGMAAFFIWRALIG